MQALVKYEKGNGHVRIQDMPEPQMADDQVMIEVAQCGICGTDLHVFHDTFKNYPPVILGHEFAGAVVDVGRNVQGIQKGDTFSVLGATAITCGQCRYCRQGEFMFCKNRRGMGHGVNGAFAPFAVARPDQLFKVPPGVSLEEAALVEPFAAAVHAVCDMANFKLGDIALVSGPGPIGLLVLKLLARQGLQVIVAGTAQDHQRLAMAKQLGAAKTIMVDQDDLLGTTQALTQGLGIDISFECAGAEASVRNCLDVLRPLGQYIQVGHFGKDLTVPWDHIAFRQLRIQGSVGYTRETWTQSLRIIAQGALSLKDIITHQLNLTDWKKGFDLMENKQAVKILLQPN